MKLNSLAVFVFRLLGALIILRAVWGIVLLADSKVGGDVAAKTLLVSIVWILSGGYLMYFSRFIAKVFCKGLDDDAA